jgi:hypothetical protein
MILIYHESASEVRVLMPDEFFDYTGQASQLSKVLEIKGYEVFRVDEGRYCKLADGFGLLTYNPIPKGLTPA